MSQNGAPSSTRGPNVIEITSFIVPLFVLSLSQYPRLLNSVHFVLMVYARNSSMTFEDFHHDSVQNYYVNLYFHAYHWGFLRSRNISSILNRNLSHRIGRHLTIIIKITFSFDRCYFFIFYLIPDFIIIVKRKYATTRCCG